MSQPLDALRFPLWGSRLIEASAGTGKTWTIAALYLRLVLGHGGADERFVRPLLPGEILVMTFTRAATRELSDRIRARLLEAAHCFRNEAEPHANDVFLRDLLGDYPEFDTRQQAAWRLAMAAEAMDEAAVFTIDAWCQRMLREHAFDSGCLFDEELIADEAELFTTAVNDYWRQQVYPLGDDTLNALLPIWPDPDRLAQDAKQLIGLELAQEAAPQKLGALIAQTQNARSQQLTELKQGWADKADTLQLWLDGHTDSKAKPFDGRKLGKANYTRWLAALKNWSLDATQDDLDLKTGWHRLTPEGILEAAKDAATAPGHPHFADIAALKIALDLLPAIKPVMLRHAASRIAARMSELKQRAGTFGFADMLNRLDTALAGDNGERLRERIVAQYPLALIDEFQDTSPLQYRIFDQLYRTADNDSASGLLLIGDPKQSIYGFRGADIHSYLAARRATEGRHYALVTNYRSTRALVAAVNEVFFCAENDAATYPHGAFRYRNTSGNPLPFEAVDALGRREKLVSTTGDTPALTIWHGTELLNNDAYRQQFAARCAEHIALQLSDPQAGFVDSSVSAAHSAPHPPPNLPLDGGGVDSGNFKRLKPADIAVLVRTGKEAAAVRRALQQRGVASVYLSDKDSVFASQEAQDLLRWLCAVASPLDGRLARAAFATRTLDLDLAELARLTHDDLAWENRVEQLKQWRGTWQRQGVLTLLRQMLHELDLPARLLTELDGERKLTNVLHLAELLQNASLQHEGEQALIRWLAEQISGQGTGGDETVVRLESDADLVKVVTIHKSKGLEYPLVYLPFAGSFRAVDKRGRSLIEYADDTGSKQIDFSRSKEALERADEARLQEDLRLLYVALTRPRHALWLGVTATSDRGKPVLHRSALGYLLAGGATIGADDLAERVATWQSAGMALEPVTADVARTLLNRHETATPLVEPQAYRGEFERNWAMASFSALVRDLAWMPSASARDENLLETPEESAAPHTDDAPWHRFPRGALPGNFLHDQLEWLAGEGFDSIHAPEFAERLGKRCDRLGWGHRKEDVVAWLHKVVSTPLPQLGVPLCDIRTHLPEMEFWFPSEQLNTGTLDALCREHLLPGIARPALPERTLHGLLKGYADLVVEHGGKYWVIDYKSNALGKHDADYHPAALAGAMAEHRYDVQAALYLLALHRLLRQRLGASYQPATQLGGAIYLFMRGINRQPEAGCYCIPADGEWLNTLDDALTARN